MKRTLTGKRKKEYSEGAVRKTGLTKRRKTGTSGQVAKKKWGDKSVFAKKKIKLTFSPENKSIALPVHSYYFSKAPARSSRRRRRGRKRRRLHGTRLPQHRGRHTPQKMSLAGCD